MECLNRERLREKVLELEVNGRQKREKHKMFRWMVYKGIKKIEP